MNVKLVIQVAPGEEGMAESHSYTLKEAKTTSQVLEFVDARVRPFLGSQTTLQVALEQEQAPPLPSPAPKKVRGGKGRSKKSAPPERDDHPDDVPDDDDDGLLPFEVERDV
jgi:hypothetical protein